MLIPALLRIFLLCVAHTTDAGPTVATTCGPVEGFQKDGAYNFLGIPYASPPVGKLRWRPPVPLSQSEGNCWQGTYNASKYGNTCVQRSISDPKTLIGDEDCLYLNVLTPTVDPTAKKEVMVWIHGGFLQYLNGNWPLYSPTARLAHETDVVYVGFNYRLQAFGFMSLKMLADDSPTKTSGNYGFMDMITVLKWVQDNIANFGGDPNKVTVFGQSSGGTAIFGLLASPLCKGLFHKAWMLSASPIMNKTAADAYKDNEVFLRNAHCSDVDCLYAMTARDVTLAVPWDTYPYWAMTDQGDLPTKGYFDGALAVVDGYVLPKAPFDAWADGEGVDVPVLIGSCANEIDDYPTVLTINTWNWTQYITHVHDKLGTFGSSIVEEALSLYPPNKLTPEFQLTSMAADLRVNCPTDVLAWLASSSFRSPIFRYVVTSWPSTPVHAIGFPFPASYSFHTWDVFAFFGFIPDYIKHPTQKDFEWQRNVQNEVMSFVRTGRPASAAWRQYPVATAALSWNTTAVQAYNSVECEFWLKNGFFGYAWIN